MRTSASVKMKHATGSLAKEAAGRVIGAGREMRPSSHFVPSHVVKNAPARRKQYLVCPRLNRDAQQRIVAGMTL